MDQLHAFITAFLRFEYADEMMIALGAFLVLVGISRILKSSLTLVVWVLLSGLGVASISYGMNRSAIDLPFLQAGSERLVDLVGQQAGLSAEALAVMCARLRGD